jgi:pimeloyl-ACP methyl ester carboxylesterase
MIERYLKQIIIEDKPIAYYDNEKSGKIILLIHGNSLDSRLFEKLFEEKSLNTYRLIAVDLPGCGKSYRDLPETVDLFEYLKLFFAKLVNELNLENYFVVAHSLGAHLITHALSKDFHPSAIILTGAVPLTGVQDMAVAFNPHPIVNLITKGDITEEDFHAIDDAFKMSNGKTFPYGSQMWKNTSPLFRTGIVNSITNGVIGNEQLKLLDSKIPVLVYNGDLDQLINRIYFTNLKLKNNFKFENSANAGHALPWEKPEEFSKAVGAFYSEFNSA